MALSSGTKHAMGEAASWLTVTVIMFGSVYHFDTLRDIAGHLLGIPGASESTVADRSERRKAPTARRRSSSIRAAAHQDVGSGSVELRAGRHGHFVTYADINGQEAKVLVDTGASTIALTDEDAAAAGIYPAASDYTVRIMTANGMGRAAPVTLDSVTIGDITVHNVRALVNQPGTLQVTLLGMTFLNRLSKVDISEGRMRLEQ